MAAGNMAVSRASEPRSVGAPRAFTPRVIGPGVRAVPVVRFSRPYYAFRPRVRLGLGLWVGVPIAYPYYYGYHDPYYDPYASSYPYPYPPYGYAYPATNYPPYPQARYPPAPYPSSGYSPSVFGSVGVQPGQGQNNTGGVSF